MTQVVQRCVFLITSILCSHLMTSSQQRVIGATISQSDSLRSDSPTAASLFREGKFLEAEQACEAVLSRQPKDYQCTLLRGRIALLSNRLEDAERLLTNAKSMRPDDREPKMLLAEVSYRRDRFDEAAVIEQTLGRKDHAGVLQSFHDLVPYQVDAKTNETHVRFIYTDPLPVVAVRVNHSAEANFLVDTGAGELVLGADFAKRAGVQFFGTQMGTFAGGRQAAVHFGRANSITLGDLEIRNIPVTVMASPPSSLAHGKPVDGIIGTVLLYHFISTIDYPKGELVLRKRRPETLHALEQLAQKKGQIVLPFWMAADHFMVSWGSAETSKPVLFLVDTGLAGFGFAAAQSFLKEAGISLESGEHEGISPGGPVNIKAFTVNDLSLGPAHEHGVRGVYGAFPPEAELSHGFRIAGAISHAFFRPYALTLDFTRMHMFLQSQSRADSSSH